MNNNIFSRLSAMHLRRAADIKERLEQLEKDLTGIMGIPPALTVGAMVRRHTGMAESTKAKLRAAAKKRWAKIRAGSSGSATDAKSTAITGRKPMSAAARARLSALMKAKWAAKNKAGS